MGAVRRIKNLDDLLGKYIGNELKVAEVVETSLLPPGENYGSVLLKLDVTLKGKGGYEEKLHAVAKILPESPMMRKLFNVEVTVRKEIAFYTIVVPKLQNFQRQSGTKDRLDFFPEFYGGRLNLNGGKVVDDDSVIVLENLLEAGFRSPDRRLGYDLDEAKLVLRNLAALHAIPLAMKYKRPMEFRRHVKTHCEELKEELPEEMRANPNTFLEILYENDRCLPYISKIKQNMATTYSSSEPREPFATLSHDDMWINNTMIKYDKGVPVEVKFFDFQQYVYDSPVPDLSKFLITSVRLPVLADHLDELLKCYHDTFVERLRQLDADVTDFGWTEFLNEFELVSRQIALQHLDFLMYVVYGEKSSRNHGGPNVFMTSKDIHLKAKEKIWFVVQEWGRRGWL